MKLRQCIFNFLLFLVSSCMYRATAQDLIQDSLVISIDKLEYTEHANLVIDTVIDAREVPNRQIGVYELNKYWLIPVDLLIQTERPLAESLNHIFKQPAKTDTGKIQISIEKFSVNKNTNSLFYPHYHLNASIQLFNINSVGQSDYIGRLLYEPSCRAPFFSDDLQDGFQSVVNIWINEFAHDLEKMHMLNNSSSTGIMFNNLRRDIHDVNWINFYGGFDYIFGFRERLIDGEFYFSHREARSTFYRSGYGIRYRMADLFESIEFGSSVDYLLFRISSSIVVQLKSQLLIGANRWKDYRKTEHEIYDIFIGDFALSQCVILNPLDKTSLLIGLGLSEDLSYVYSRGLKFHIGLLVHMGFKL